jgi:hypothetical protein
MTAARIKRSRGKPSPFLDLPDLPGGKRVRTALVMGERAEALTIYLSSLAASRELQVLVADGANAFDPYLVSKFARREGFPPEELLRKIWVARAFTCHQLVTLIRERLDPMVPPEVPILISLLGPCTLFFDEDVPEKEATLLFRRMLTKIEEMSQEGISFLMSQSFCGFHRGRGFLLRELMRFSDAVLRLKSSSSSLQVTWDKPPLALRRPWEAFEQFKEIV